jgi:hypothetical protein
VRRASTPLDEGSEPTLATGVKETHFSDDGLAAGSTYYYQVTASNAHASGGPSNERGATVGVPGGFEAPSPAFAFSARVPGAPVPPLSPVALEVTATDTASVPGTGILFAMQVHDATGRLVFQKIFQHQRFAPGESRPYSFSWTPDAPGTYVLEIGAFGDEFAPRYNFDKHAAILIVTAGK